MGIIERVKALLGITDNLQDNLLLVVQDLTEANFKAYSGQSSIPTPLEFIIVEVMVKRFNRIGSEGMKSQKVEGLAVDFAIDDFLEYDKVIKRHFSDQYQAGFKML